MSESPENLAEAKRLIQGLLDSVVSAETIQQRLVVWGTVNWAAPLYVRGPTEGAVITDGRQPD